MKFSKLYQNLFFTIPYLYLNRAWLCDNCKVQPLKCIYQSKCVLTTSWYRNKMYLFLYARIQRGAEGLDTPLLITKIIEFLNNTGPDPIKITTFNVWPSSAAGETPFNWCFAGVKWRFAGGPMMARF